MGCKLKIKPQSLKKVVSLKKKSISLLKYARNVLCDGHHLNLLPRFHHFGQMKNIPNVLCKKASRVLDLLPTPPLCSFYQSCLTYMGKIIKLVSNTGAILARKKKIRAKENLTTCGKLTPNDGACHFNSK